MTVPPQQAPVEEGQQHRKDTMPNFTERDEKKDKPMPIGVWVAVAVVAAIILVAGKLLGS